VQLDELQHLIQEARKVKNRLQSRILQQTYLLRSGQRVVQQRVRVVLVAVAALRRGRAGSERESERSGVGTHVTSPTATRVARTFFAVTPGSAISAAMATQLLSCFSTNLARAGVSSETAKTQVEGEKAAKRPSPFWTPCAAGHAPAQPLVLDCVKVVPPAAFAGSGLGALGRRPALTASRVGVRLGRILSLGRPVRAHRGCVSSLARATHAQHAKAAACAAPPRRRRRELRSCVTRRVRANARLLLPRNGEAWNACATSAIGRQQIQLLRPRMRASSA